WDAIAMQTPAGPVNVGRNGAAARVTQGAKTITIDLKPGTALWENLNPALASLAVRAYDRAMGGRQVFPFFIVPTIVMDAGVEYAGSIERAIAGKDVPLDQYRFALPGATVTVTTDPAGHVVYAEVPSQHAAYVREGYEALMTPAATDSLLSPPSFEV